MCSWALSEEAPQGGLPAAPDVPLLTVTDEQGTTRFLEDRKPYLGFHEIQEYKACDVSKNVWARENRRFEAACERATADGASSGCRIDSYHWT